MTWLFGLKVYALCSLLFSAGWAWTGWRWSKRRELAAIKSEYRWHMSPIYLHEPQDVIRAKEIIQ